MFDDMIQKIRDYCRDLEEKQCKKLSIEEFGNMLCVLSDKGLIDDRQKAQQIEALIDGCYYELRESIDTYVLERQAVKVYKKSYAKLVLEVKNTFDLEPIGSIQSRYTSLGMAVGVGIGTALMSATNPAMISVGIGAGLAIGAGIGAKKESQAKEAGKLY